MEAITEFPKLFSPPEVATVLRIHPVTLRQWRQVGKGPKYVKIGGRYFYTEGALHTYLNRGGSNQG